MSQLTTTDPTFRLNLLEQKFDVLSGEINSALSENRKMGELQGQMSIAATKVMDARLTALEEFAQKVRAAISDLNARLVAMETPDREGREL